MRHRWLGLIIIGLLCLFTIASGLQSTRPVQVETGRRFFPETGHVVEGDFLTYYNNLSDPLRLLGYPITDILPDPFSGRPTQYFQKARLELHADTSLNDDRQWIQLTPIGEYVYDAGDQIAPLESSNGCQSYPWKGKDYQVCYAFLNFFKNYGGIDYFGSPISSMEYQDGRIVQYFQNARLDWYPEYPPGERVVVSNLGLVYFHLLSTNPIHLSQSNSLPQTILELKVHAYPAQAVTGLQGQQTIFVIVQDQNLLAVPNARVVFKVLMPSGREAILPADTPTDGNGVARLTLPFSTTSPGVIIVTAIARYDNFKQETVTSFRTWW
jgi:hypothetical protein